VITSAAPRRRIAAVGLSAASALVLLTACEKPAQRITVLAGDRSTIVEAQPDCVAAGQCGVQTSKVAGVTAPAGSKIMIDVPRKVAGGGWIVAAFVLDEQGKQKALEGAGSNVVKDEHVVRVVAPLNKSGGYYLQIAPAPGSSVKESWLVKVSLTQ